MIRGRRHAGPHAIPPRVVVTSLHPYRFLPCLLGTSPRPVPAAKIWFLPAVIRPPDTLALAPDDESLHQAQAPRAHGEASLRELLEWFATLAVFCRASKGGG